MDNNQRIACKNFFLKRMSRVRKEIRDQLAERAVDNLTLYYSLLHSTKERGMSELVEAIHNSTYSTSKSHRHHHYPSGTMEHSLGVYKLMSEKAELLRQQGHKIKESDLILVALLHDVAQGKCAEWTQYAGHGRRSRAIVERYLPDVSPEVLEAINGHMHLAFNSNVLWHLINQADHRDAATCNKGYAKISDTDTVSL
jgi:HD superfamily phosphohydrolase YqeK